MTRSQRLALLASAVEQLASAISYESIDEHGTESARVCVRKAEEHVRRFLDGTDEVPCAPKPITRTVRQMPSLETLQVARDIEGHEPPLVRTGQGDYTSDYTPATGGGER